MTHLLLDCSCQIAETKHSLMDMISPILNGLITCVGVVVASVLAYRYGIKKLNNETFILLQREKLNRKLLALEGCWKLLAFTTDTENEKSVMIWHRHSNQQQNIYFIRKGQASEFIKSLADFFYSSGMGIYLSVNIKALLFEYRSILFGVLLATKEENTQIEVRKQEMADRMISIHQELIKLLKIEIEGISVKKEM